MRLILAISDLNIVLSEDLSGVTMTAKDGALTISVNGVDEIERSLLAALPKQSFTRKPSTSGIATGTSSVVYPKRSSLASEVYQALVKDIKVSIVESRNINHPNRVKSPEDTKLLMHSYYGVQDISSDVFTLVAGENALVKATSNLIGKLRARFEKDGHLIAFTVEDLFIYELDETSFRLILSVGLYVRS